MEKTRKIPENSRRKEIVQCCRFSTCSEM